MSACASILVRRVGPIALLGSFALATGCGRFGYEAVNLSEIDAGADASNDSAVDGALLDGTIPGLDGSIAPPCDDTAIVCSSFDDDSGFMTYFNGDGQIGIVFGVLDVTTTAPGGAAWYLTSFPAITSGQLYFAGLMRIVGNNAITGVNPFMIGSNTQSDFGLDFNLINDGEFEVYPSTTVGGAVSAAILPRDQWICLAGEITVGDGTTGAVSVTANGAPLVSTTAIDTLPPGGITDLRVGIDWTRNDQPNMRIQWDAFGLARTPIGCP